MRCTPVMIALLAAVLLLVAAPAVHAKRIAQVEVCGQGACNVLVPGNGLGQRDLLALTEVTAPADPPSIPTGWFRVRVTMEHPGADAGSWTHAWVPGANLLRAGNDAGDGYTWFTVPRDTALSFLKLTHRLDPLPPLSLRGLDARLPRPRRAALPVAPDGGPPWGWIAGAAGLACLTAARLRRRAARIA